MKTSVISAGFLLLAMTAAAAAPARLNVPGLAVGSGTDGIQAGPFLLLGENRFAEDQTTVRFHWDRDALYAEFIGTDRSLNPQANRLHEFKSKEKNPWRNDYMILLLKRGPVMYDFLVTGGGRLEDGKMTGPNFWENRDNRWESGAETAAEIRNGFWRSTLKIPWRSIGGPPKEGESIRFQTGRKTRSSNETSVLFPSRAGYHAAQDFGVMVFRNQPAPELKIELPEILPGKNRISLPSTVNSEILITYPDKTSRVYRGGTFDLNRSGKFTLQWKIADRAAGLPWFVSPRYKLEVSACRLEIPSAESVELNGSKIRSGAILKSGLNQIRLPDGFTGKLSVGGTEIKPPAENFPLAVDCSLLWPNWHERELSIPAGGIQMLMFAPRGFPGKVIRDYTIKLDLPPGFKLECASGYYQIYKINWTEDGWIRFQTPLRYSRKLPMHRFISAFIRAPRETANPIEHIAYAASSESGKIIEVPRKIPVRVLPAFTGVQPKHFRLIAWAGSYRRLTEKDYLQQVAMDVAKYGINDMNGIPGKHVPFSNNFNLLYSWKIGAYVKLHPESALILKDGKRNPNLVCPQFIRTEDFAKWLDAQMPRWLDLIGNPQYAEWDHEFPYDSGPFSCYCEKCQKESDVASRNRMTAYFAKLLSQSMKRCDPKIKFVIYSGYQSEETKRHYGIDWSLFPGIIDMAECGYGRSEKLLKATREALRGTPLVTGAIIRPYQLASRAFPEPFTPALLLRRALDATGGVLLYEYSLFDGKSLQAIAAVSKIIARYEDWFRFGKRLDSHISGWAPDEAQIVEYRGRSVLFLMNNSKTPRKYRDQMIGPGETAVHELPVSEAQQQLEKSK